MDSKPRQAVANFVFFFPFLFFLPLSYNYHDMQAWSQLSLACNEMKEVIYRPIPTKDQLKQSITWARCFICTAQGPGHLIALVL